VAELPSLKYNIAPKNFLNYILCLFNIIKIKLELFIRKLYRYCGAKFPINVGAEMSSSSKRTINVYDQRLDIIR